MPYLLPDDLDPDVFKCLTIRIPDDPQWEVNFWGALLQLSRWFNHERDALHKATIVANKWREWIDDSMSCNAITGMTIVNNKLLIQYCNSDVWVTVGPISTIPMRYQNGQMQYDVNGDGTFEVSQYLNYNQYLFGEGLPIADANDRICRASWMLARAICDDYRDAITILRAATNAVIKGAKWIVALMAGHAGAPESVQFVGEGIAGTILDWLDNNIMQPETIQMVAELIYCALVEKYPDDLNDFWDAIDLDPYDPLGFLDPLDQIVQWLNMEAITTLAYNTATGRNSGYLALAYAKLASTMGLEAVGFFTPVNQLMTSALSSAEYFDGRDCEDFPCMIWEHQINFTTETLIVFGFPNGLSMTSQNQNATWEGPNKKRQICSFRLAPFEGVEYSIIKARAEITTSQQTWEAVLLDYEGGPEMDRDNTHTSGNTERILEPIAPITGMWMWIASQIQEPNTPFQFSMTVTIYGTGTNPFE